MRYFCDLGADAHLLIYSNEGTQEVNPQYAPEWDTWSYDKWKDRVHVLPFPNGIESVIGRAYKFRLPPSKSKILNSISGYDVYIGSGISPSLFSRINKKLTIFFPYSGGIEWVYEPEFSQKLSSFNLETIFRYYVRYKQISGIKKSKVCINSEMSITADAFKRIGKKFQKISAPQYYNREEPTSIVDDILIKNTLEYMLNYDYVVFSHMRHFWVQDKGLCSDSDFQTISKNNDWLIVGFSQFLLKQDNSKSLLVLVDWGKDAGVSRKLVVDLNIENNVLWLPLLSRKQATFIMKHCDISVGQFGVLSGRFGGSTTFESLAIGMPTLQTFNYTAQEYMDEFDHEPPPFLDVKSKEDVTMHLSNMYSDKEGRVRMGKQSKAWFNEHNGISLAEKWLKILEENC